MPPAEPATGQPAAKAKRSAHASGAGRASGADDRPALFDSLRLFLYPGADRASTPPVCALGLTPLAGSGSGGFAWGMEFRGQTRPRPVGGVA
jgi:hypothetical protein